MEYLKNFDLFVNENVENKSIYKFDLNGKIIGI